MCIWINERIIFYTSEFYSEVKSKAGTEILRLKTEVRKL
jgi:hypothetical protein